MRLADYSQVVTQSEDENAAMHCISGVSRVLLLAGLEQLEHRFNWIDGIEELTDEQFDDVEAWISNACLELMVVCETIGEIIMYVSEVVPLRCLPCDGTIYAAADYPELYEVIDPELKNVEDELFEVPSLIGRMPIGEDTSQGFDLDMAGGQKDVTLSSNQMPAHSHTIQYAIISQAGAGSSAPIVGIGLPISTSSAGGGNSHTNMPPWKPVRFAIRCGREVV